MLKIKTDLHFQYVTYFQHCLVAGKRREMADSVVYRYACWESNASFNLLLHILVQFTSLPLQNTPHPIS